ncbi:MAG: FHA domain-containing protein [Ectothiorhodospiraceae bacterium]|nr:FHA domain-containing protein [Ectothiorhodospiraceae bacterium]MBN4052998.1 FHA domain-containing protein [Gammaproteobacteria bacterium AH-315-K14]
MPKLVHSRDGQFIEDIELKEGRWLIGRRPECDIRVDDETVSGKHALLTATSSVYMEGLLDIHIEDKGSTNGTTVNGKKVKRHMLKHGEILKIGEHEFAMVDEATRGFETTTVVLPD